MQFDLYGIDTGGGGGGGGKHDTLIMPDTPRVAIERRKRQRDRARENWGKEGV
jgi:hypothetical protein